MKKVSQLLFLGFTLLLAACQHPKEIKIEANDLHLWNQELEKAIVNDFFSPPVAGRIYAYPNICAYEILSQKEDAYQSVTIQMEGISIPAKEEDVNLQIAAIYGFYQTSIQLVYSIDNLEKAIAVFEDKVKKQGLDESALEASKKYGKEVAQIVLNWAKEDGYKAMRSYDEYTPLAEEGKWVPTPPDYSAALEPHWKQLRPFVLKSADQFKPELPTSYSLDSNSQFIKETMEVYYALNNNTPETESIAKFWDCNPLVRKHQGHVTFAEKKLTPGGHWINIARMAMEKQQFDLMESAKLYAILCIGINDAFISCWDEKYRSNYIRPVTVIQEFIDPKWTPILYTPNFPEYPSGHSVVSGSAATILTATFGEGYAFIDSTEVPYGMPPRSFSSFYEAADEAAISRLYGGIHFMPAIENGKKQGRQVGTYVVNQMQLKKTK